MVATLVEVAETTRTGNPYFGTARLEELRREYAHLGPHTPIQELGPILFELGMEEFRSGSLDAAIDFLGRLYSSLPPSATTHRTQLAYTLGVAHLRRGERANCVDNHNPKSCLFPLAPEAVHVDPTGAEHAILYWSMMLGDTPAGTEQALAGRWLLNIAYMTLGQYPDRVPDQYLIPADRFAPEGHVPAFEEIAGDLGLDVFDLGGGAAVDDFTGNGLFDVLTSTWEPEGPLRLFENRGDGSFRDLSTSANLAGITGGLNLVPADFDNDGDLDFFVPRGAWLLDAGHHPNSLLRNDGGGTFTDITFAAGLGDHRYPTQTAAWADYDLDGDLDLFVGSESGRQPFPCQLFRNEGGGRFVDVAAAAGVENFRFTKGVTWGDFDGDRDPDLYLSNFTQPNRLYRNDGGTFTDVGPALGVTGPKDSFPTWFWDFDNDGRLDLFVGGYQQAPKGPPRLYPVIAGYLGLEFSADTDTLYRGLEGGFEEVTAAQGLARVTMPMGANFGDFDNDGYPDIYLGTGYPPYDALMPNILYRNDEGRRFLDVSAAANVGHLQKGHGIAFADLDNDGDQDLFEQMGGLFPGDAYGNVLYENPGFGHHWLRVRLVGKTSNRSAIGTRIRADITEGDRSRSVYRTVSSGGSFGANPLMQHLGLGDATTIDRLEVYWPASDLTQRFDAVRVDRAVEIVEGRDELRTLDLPRIRFARPAEADGRHHPETPDG